MSQPTPYNRLVNFVSYALAHTSATYNPSDHDSELNSIKTTLDGILANLILIQRDDGMLKNASVHPDALSAATLLLIESAGSATGLSALLKGTWVTAKAYARAELVQNGSFSYVCAVAHTSGVFATDYAAGKWIVLGSDAATNAAGISFVPAGNIVAANVQAALQELDTKKAASGGNASNQFLVSDASGATHAVSMGQAQTGSLISANGGGTGDAITASLISGLNALVDGMIVTVKAPGSNTLANPTFNLTLGVTATGAKTIVKGNGAVLVANDIASNKCQFSYDLPMDKWVLLNPIYPVSAIQIANGGTGAITAALAFAALKQQGDSVTSGVWRSGTNAEQLAGLLSNVTCTPAGLASSQSLGANGYRSHPGGSIEQWATSAQNFDIPAGGQAFTVTFPIAFTTAAYNIVAVPYSTDAGTARAIYVALVSLTTTQATFHAFEGGTNTQANWGIHYRVNGK